jgi:TPR repeat protein
LAQNLATGLIGVARDDAAAAAWAQKAALRDDQAAALLCSLYTHGINGELPDGALAFRWCSAAADSGVPAAIVTLARLYLDGTGIKRDALSALTWASIGSTRGNPTERQDAAKLRTTAANLLSPAEQQIAQTRADTWHPLP